MIWRKNKFKAQATNFAGQGFRSKLEARIYATLLLMERAGEIKDIKREQAIRLTPSISHKIDFLVTNVKTCAEYGIEGKGAETYDWLLKKRLYKDFGPIRIEIWKSLGSRVGCVEVIMPGPYKVIEKAA